MGSHKLRAESLLLLRRVSGASERPIETFEAIAYLTKPNRDDLIWEQGLRSAIPPLPETQWDKSRPIGASRMVDVKLVVLYPLPKDVGAFEKIYQNEHVPLAVRQLAGKTKIVATRILGSPQGRPPYYRVAEIYFPSMHALEQCAASDAGKEVLAHAVKISSGGAPVFLVAEEETFTFTSTANT